MTSNGFAQSWTILHQWILILNKMSINRVLQSHLKHCDLGLAYFWIVYLNNPYGINLGSAKLTYSHLCLVGVEIQVDGQWSACLAFEYKYINM